MNEEKNIDDILKDAFMDECNGVIEYLDMSKMTSDKYPNKGYAQIFRDIAREERIHKNHIKDIIKDMGVEMTEEMQTADKDSEETFEKSFC